MTTDDFLSSLNADAPPAGVSAPLAALWWERKGDWTRAHDLLQDAHGADGSWVHAYLHRVEGDLGNAAYWYRRAGKPTASGDLRDEWNGIVADLSPAGRFDST